MDIAQLKTALNNIAKSLEHVAISVQHDTGDCFIDSTFKHLWCLPKNMFPEQVSADDGSCCCGLVVRHSWMQFEAVIGDRTNGIIEDSRSEHSRSEQSRSEHNRSEHSGSEQKLIEKENQELVSSGRLAEKVDSLLVKKASMNTAFELCNVILRIATTLEHQN